MQMFSQYKAILLLMLQINIKYLRVILSSFFYVKYNASGDYSRIKDNISVEIRKFNLEQSRQAQSCRAPGA